MKKKTGIIVYSSLGVILVGLLASSLAVNFADKKHQESYSLPYEDYQNISDLDDLYGDISEKAGVDIASFNILNHSQIDLNDGGAVDDLDVSCFCIKEGKAYGIGLERSGDSYYVSISELNDVPTGDAARLSLAVGAVSAFSETSKFGSLVVTFVDENIPQINQGDLLYKEGTLMEADETIFGRFTPIQFLSMDGGVMENEEIIYIERENL